MILGACGAEGRRGGIQRFPGSDPGVTVELEASERIIVRRELRGTGGIDKWIESRGNDGSLGVWVSTSTVRSLGV